MYGGTQEEMVRLINDSGVLNEKIESMDGITFDTVIEAIHAVQENIGITGTTAQEAESTIQGSVSAMKGAWENLLVGIAAGDQDVTALFDQLADSLKTVADNLLPRIKTTLEGFFNLLTEKIPIIDELAIAIGIITAAVAMHNAVQAIKVAMNAAEVTSLGALIAMKLASAAATLAALAPYLLIAAAIAAVIAIGVLLYKNWDEIKAKCIELAGKLKESWNNIKESISEAIENAKEKVKTVFNNIKTNVKTSVDNVKSSVSNAFNSVKSAISNGLNAAKSTVTSVLNSIKSKFTSIFNSVKTTVKNAIDKVKGFMKFSWSLPKPKLPKFSVSGGKAPWGFGGAGSMPSIGIKWHAMAMKNPMLMESPTIFGYDAKNGNLLGGGEAGSEMIGGTNTIMNMISTAVASQNEGLAYLLEKILAILASYFPQVIDGLDRPICFDPEKGAAAMAVPMNKYLGILQTQKERGR